MKITLQDAADKLKAANKIVVTAHVNPDGDAIGSTIALYQILKALGKDVTIYIDDKLPKNFVTMPGAEDIKRPVEGEKISADLLVILDTAPDRVGKVIEVCDAPILNIDHHVTNNNAENFLYVDATASATCEIIFYFSKILGVELTLNMAVCLYIGMATDTGFFNYSNTKPATFKAAAELVELGVMPNLVSENLERRTAHEIKILSLALQTTKLYFGGKVAGMFVDEKLSAQSDNTEGLIDLIRVIEGVEVAFLLKFKAKKICRVSMRSKTVDVSKIAQRLGGGGHVRAAGCTIEENFDDAKKILIDAIGNYMVEVNKISQADFNSDIELALEDVEN